MTYTHLQSMWPRGCTIFLFWPRSRQSPPSDYGTPPFVLSVESGAFFPLEILKKVKSSISQAALQLQKGKGSRLVHAGLRQVLVQHTGKKKKKWQSVLLAAWK